MIIMDIINKVSDSIIKASTTFSKDHKNALINAIKSEENTNSLWVLEQILENFKIAEKTGFPLCDDTGIPHAIIEVGKNREITGELINQIKEGIYLGLESLPGRPMAVKGNDTERIEQSLGLYENPGMVRSPSFLIETQNDYSTYGHNIDKNCLNIHFILLGGGPEIRAKTYRIFHKRSHLKLLDEAISWLINSLGKLGCTPTIPSIGIGRTHFEATSLMLKSLVHGNLNNQSSIEKYVTNSINRSGIGPMGLGGETTALGTFVNIGNQRASGVRILSIRPSCFVEPRVATLKL